MNGECLLCETAPDGICRRESQWVVLICVPHNWEGDHQKLSEFAILSRGIASQTPELGLYSLYGSALLFYFVERKK